MSLKTEDRKRLVNTLLTAYPTVDLFRIFMDTEVGHTLEHITTASGLEARILEVVSIAQSGWLDELLSAATRSPNDHLKDLAAELMDRCVAGDNQKGRQGGGELKPEYACFPRKRAMVNRERLRRQLRTLHEGNDERVLVVLGPRRSGKTRSKYLIQHLSEQHRDFKPAIFDFATNADPAQVTVDEVARVIGRKMGLQASELDQELDAYAQGARQSESLCAWILNQVRKDQAGQSYWLIFDSLDLVVLDPGVIDLLHRFVDMAEEEERIRVVLLGYTDDLEIVDQYSLRDELQDVAIGQSDLEHFCNRYANEKGVEVADGVAAEFAHRVLDGLPAEHESRNYEISNRVERYIGSLLELPSEGVP